MAAGDPYFECDNANLSLTQVMRDMIVKDAEGNPAWRIYGSGGGGGGSSVITESDLTVASQAVTLPTHSYVIGIFYNGQRLEQGVGYSKSGNTITLLGNPSIDNGEKLVAVTVN